MASFGAPAPAPTLSLEQTRAALKEVDALLADAAVLAQITAVKTAAGPDAMMAMMLVSDSAYRQLCCGLRGCAASECSSVGGPRRVPPSSAACPAPGKARSCSRAASTAASEAAG